MLLSATSGLSKAQPEKIRSAASCVNDQLPFNSVTQQQLKIMIAVEISVTGTQLKRQEHRLVAVRSGSLSP